MADQDEIDLLRRLAALEANDPVYTDELLGGMIDDLTIRGAAAQVWKEKAAAAASLVDTTESGSSRSLSQLRKGYLEMAAAIGPAEEEPVSGGMSFTVAIERV